MNPAWRPDAPPNFVKLAVARCLAAEMDRSRWLELRRVADAGIIESHSRLLRSLSFGDDDYEDCVHEVVPAVLGEQPDPVAAPPGPWGDPWGTRSRNLRLR